MITVVKILVSLLLSIFLNQSIKIIIIMKKMDNTKKAVLVIGALVLVSGFMGIINSESLMEQFFPLYTGFTLIGTVVFHKESKLSHK